MKVDQNTHLFFLEDYRIKTHPTILVIGFNCCKEEKNIELLEYGKVTLYTCKICGVFVCDIGE